MTFLRVASTIVSNSTVPVRLILGSASPRRLELLAQIGVVPDEIRPADIDETPVRGEPVRDYVRRMAREKARATQLADGEVVLCADTTVSVGRRILGKPEDAVEAAAFLRLMSGRRHKVLTAICLRSATRELDRLSETTVRFRALSDAEIASYVDSGEWRGKAGGYGIQGGAAAFIPWLQGSFSSVVGLPLSETALLLGAMGVR